MRQRYSQAFNLILTILGAVVVVASLRMIAYARPADVFNVEFARPPGMAMDYRPADRSYAETVKARFSIIGGHIPPSLAVTVGYRGGQPPTHYIDVQISRFEATDLLLASTPEEREAWAEAVLLDARSRWPGDRIVVSLLSSMWFAAPPFDGACSVAADLRDGAGWEQTQYYAYASWPDPVDEYSDGVIECIYPD